MLYSGTVDGKPVSVEPQRYYALFDSTAPSHFYQQLGAHWLMFTSPTDFPETAPTTFPAPETLLLGGWPGAGDTWYCSQDATLTTVDASVGRYTFSIPTLRRLGTCPAGTPVAGSIEVCYDAADPTACQNTFKSEQSYTLEGSVDGNALPDKAVDIAQGGDDVNVSVTFRLDDRRQLAFLIDATGTTKVLLKLPEAGTGNHRLYCADSIPDLDPAARRIKGTLTGLSRLGACADAPVAGSLTGCL
ncbi:MAG: hypothetical protein EOO75_20265 [Myxococcales bacterium]|nr:MAG: hypothetical protein EOO75_20265 [Myxococcales bacterium]